MMGFADKFVRFVRGEPLYQPGDISAEEQQQTAAVTPGTSPQDVVPIVIVKNVISEATNNGMRVHATLENQANETIKLHEIELLGITTTLDLTLSAKEVKQDVVLYDGQAIANSNVGVATLRYRTFKLDTPFKATYALGARMVDAGRLGITDFNLQLPISTE
jgi:hypothetical protein